MCLRLSTTIVNRVDKSKRCSIQGEWQKQTPPFLGALCMSGTSMCYKIFPWQTFKWSFQEEGWFSRKKYKICIWVISIVYCILYTEYTAWPHALELQEPTEEIPTLNHKRPWLETQQAESQHRKTQESLQPQSRQRLELPPIESSFGQDCRSV